MKIICATLLAILIVFGVSKGNAAWVWLGESNWRGIDHNVYIESKKIKRDRNHVFYVILYDVGLVEGTSSTKQLILGDCELYRIKRLAIEMYKDSMGRGKLLRSMERSQSETPWETFPINSIEGRNVRTACEMSE